MMAGGYLGCSTCFDEESVEYRARSLCFSPSSNVSGKPPEAGLLSVDALFVQPAIHKGPICSDGTVTRCVQLCLPLEPTR